jgi:elongation factor P--(R)-beta-lysine ligase
MTVSAFMPTASVEDLIKRSQVLRRARAFFDNRDFIEVQTPVLSRHCVIDRHLDPFTVRDEYGNEVRFFQTSPEQGMKRLLAAGMKNIYQLGPVFREGEFGRLHNPEFTMLEWYRVGDGLREGIEILDALIRDLLDTPPAIAITYQSAFVRAVGLDPLEAQIQELASWCVDRKLVASHDWTDDRDDWLDLIFSDSVQPSLGLEHPEVITHFPASQAALARIAGDDARTCERFELFIDGIELANGYHELLDAAVLRDRNRQANCQRAKAGKQTLPEENLLLDAMESGLPACTGCALGFDRLVMIAVAAKSLDQVICFPWDRA